MLVLFVALLVTAVCRGTLNAVVKVLNIVEVSIAIDLRKKEPPDADDTQEPA